MATLSHRPMAAILAFVALSIGAGLAQARSPALVAPPWRPPTLVVAGAEQPVRLQSLKIETEVAGGVAETRVEMAFFNPNARVLEGKLQFPLGHPAVVSVIPGGQSPDQVRSNLTLLDVPIPGELWAELKAEGLVREDAPTP